MNDKELQSVQNDLLNEIDLETKTDNDIKAAAEEIAAALYLSGVTRYSFNNVAYTFKSMVDNANKKVIITAADEAKFKLLLSKYRPFIIESPIDKDYTVRQTLTAAVEGFIRHITGNIKPEILDDEE